MRDGRGRTVPRGTTSRRRNPVGRDALIPPPICDEPRWYGGSRLPCKGRWRGGLSPVTEGFGFDNEPVLNPEQNPSVFSLRSNPPPFAQGRL
jgi:hypothetical protein